jgi:hypothetical protein
LIVARSGLAVVLFWVAYDDDYDLIVGEEITLDCLAEGQSV